MFPPGHRLAGKHLTSPTLACLLHLTPDIPPQWRPLTPDPGLTTKGDVSRILSFLRGAALFFSAFSLSAADWDEVKGIQAFSERRGESCRCSCLYTSQVQKPLNPWQPGNSQTMCHPPPPWGDSVFCFTVRALGWKSRIQRLILTSSSPADNENIHINCQHARMCDITWQHSVTQQRQKHSQTRTFVKLENNHTGRTDRCSSNKTHPASRLCQKNVTVPDMSNISQLLQVYGSKSGSRSKHY